LGKPVVHWSLQTYLTQQDLPGNPRTRSVWTHMHSVGNDRAFVTVMGVDVQTFESILVPFDLAWNASTIRRGDVNPNGAPQPSCQSLDSAGALALLLHWLSSTMAAYLLLQIFSITAAICSLNLIQAWDSLIAVLKTWRFHKSHGPHPNRSAGATVTWLKINTRCSQLFLDLSMAWTFRSM
jgi:hypothetical protein